MKNASNRFLTVLMLIICLAFIFACSENEDEVVDGDIDAESIVEESENTLENEVESAEEEADGIEETPEMPLALCGMASYDLVPRDNVGHLVEQEKLALYDLSPQVIENMLSETGYAGEVDITYGCRSYNFRYTTQDRGVPVEATATMAIPANAELPEQDWPFALFLHGSTGFSDPCAPSRSGEGAQGACLLASQGYVTIAPDYIGMNGFGAASTVPHGYLVGEQVAIGSWDALRAARELMDAEEDMNLPTDMRVMVWGGSQGGHAALFTELYGAYYAPEYTVPGVLALIPPLNLEGLLDIGVESFSPPTSALLAVLTTMRAWYGKPDDLLDVFTNTDPFYLADNAESYVFVEGEDCDLGDDIKEIDTIEEIFTPEFVEAVNGEWDDLTPWNCFFDENSIARTSVQPLRFTPTLIVFSELDDLCVTAPQLPEFDRLCEQGYKLDYMNCIGAGHSEGAAWSIPEQFAWAKARLNGEPQDAEKICVRTDPVCCSASPEDVCQ